MRTAAIVLAGGGSTRMGRPKAMLEWHGSTLVRRAAGLAGRAVDGPVVVVRAAGQELPALPPDVEIAQDAHAARGPLQGIAAGLALVGNRAGAVFVCGVDTPLLHPALIGHVVAALMQDPECEVALPVAHGFPHPLCAAYRTTISRRLDDLLAEDRLATKALLARCRVRELGEAALLADAALREHDPQLDSLLNINVPDEYAAARQRRAPVVTVVGEGDVRAATLADAGDGAATVNGRAVADPQEPLAAGDEVAFVMRRRYRPAP